MAANEVAALFFLLSTKLCRSFSFHLLLVMLRVLLLPPIVILIEEQDDDDADDDVDATPRAIKTLFAILFASLSDSSLSLSLSDSCLCSESSKTNEANVSPLTSEDIG
jgi:hypothetical protein